MHQKISYLQSIKIIILALLIAVGTSYLSADWTKPVSTPPTCNAGDPGCDAPLNVGYFSQVKQGNLNIRGISDATHAYVNGLIVENGFVGIGTTAPGEKLDVVGNINISTDSAYKYNGTNVITAQNALNNFYFGNSGNLTGTGYTNTANGVLALHSNTTGYANTANGVQALYSNTTGSRNIANGVKALYSNTIGTYNTANGFQALYSNIDGNYNTANGHQALYSNTTGAGNTAMGREALYFNTGGYVNTAIGAQALNFNTTGWYNTAIGDAALYLNTGGYDNTAIGTQALYDLNITVKYAGSNTALGSNTGRGLVTGINNTILGANVHGLAAGLSNNIIIADGAGNQRIRVIENGNVGIGTTAPTSKLQVVGLSVYANNAAAVAGGLTTGAFYRTGADPDPVMVVH